MNGLPYELATILSAAQAGDRLAYEENVDKTLCELAYQMPADEYVDGMERDALLAWFQRHGFDAIPTPENQQIAERDHL